MDYEPLTGGQERAYAELEACTLAEALHWKKMGPALISALESITKNCIRVEIGNVSGVSGCTVLVRMEDIMAAHTAIRKAKGGQ